MERLLLAIFLLVLSHACLVSARIKHSFPCGLQSTPADQFCVDSTMRCCEWARNNECQINPSYMNRVCCASCRSQGPPSLTCRDLHPRCRYWASYGQCAENETYMSYACPVTCNKCGNPGEFPPSFTRDFAFFPKGSDLRHVFEARFHNNIVKHGIV